MSEQNNKEKKTKEWMKKFKRPFAKGNKLYLLTAVGCAVALIAIVVVAVAVTGSKQKINNQLQNSTNVTPPANSSVVDKPEKPDDGKVDEPVITTPEGMITPIEAVSSINDYGFYYNKTLNSYYEHAGVDFMAEKGTQVLAVEDGKVESIFKDDLLSGTEIVLNHGDGIKTVYRFITEVEGLKVGDSVKKGDVIATVAEANGDEYKEGAHLHFEVLKNGKNVDPAEYLTLEEK